MAKIRPPKKGSTIWIPVPEIEVQPDDEGPAVRQQIEGTEGVELGIKYHGSRQVRGWTLQLQKDSAEEAKRVSALRAEHSKEAWPELYDEGFMTSEGLEAALLTQDVVLEACLVGVRGIEGIGEEDPQAARDYVEYLGADVEGAVFNRCLEVQSLSKRERFRPARVGG